jgi:hypothetical protein
MSVAASAENTMKIMEHKLNDSSNNSINNNNNNNTDSGHLKCENEDKIFFKSALSDSDDDDMVVIILQEDVVQNNKVEKTKLEEGDKKEDDNGGADNGTDTANVHVHVDATNIDTQGEQDEQGERQQGERQQGEKNTTVSQPPQPKQKYIGVEVYTHLQQTLESQKMYPLLPCNMISSFARVMEYVEYFDLPSEERKRLVIDLVKILAYSNNDYGSRDCFEYFVQHNMIDDIVKTIVDSTKNRYDINRFPHTNRKIVLSCVSLSNKIKIVKPSAKIESLFEELKVNLCGLKRFFKVREKEESKQT